MLSAYDNLSILFVVFAILLVVIFVRKTKLSHQDVGDFQCTWGIKIGTSKEMVAQKFGQPDSLEDQGRIWKFFGVETNGNLLTTTYGFDDSDFVDRISDCMLKYSSGYLRKYQTCSQITERIGKPNSRISSVNDRKETWRYEQWNLIVHFENGRASEFEIFAANIRMSLGERS